MSLLATWEAAGLNRADFWASTPREAIASLRGRHAYFLREQNLAVMQAYYTAALYRWNTKKRPYPKLDDLLTQSAPKRATSVDEQWQRMRSIAATRRAMN